MVVTLLLPSAPRQLQSPHLQVHQCQSPMQQIQESSCQHHAIWDNAGLPSAHPRSGCELSRLFLICGSNDAGLRDGLGHTTGGLLFCLVTYLSGIQLALALFVFLFFSLCMCVVKLLSKSWLVTQVCTLFQTTEGIYCYSRAPGRDHWRFLADAMGEQLHHCRDVD